MSCPSEFFEPDNEGEKSPSTPSLDPGQMGRPGQSTDPGQIGPTGAFEGVETTASGKLAKVMSPKNMTKDENRCEMAKVPSEEPHCRRVAVQDFSPMQVR